MIQMILGRVVKGETLSKEEASEVMTMMMEGKLTSEQIASLISMMRIRGETTEEISGFLQTMRRYMKTLNIAETDSVIDTCGTGGDGTSTFNISTAAAIVLASMGIKVAKHGNRSVSSSSGSADVLEMLGIPVEQTQEEGVMALKEKKLTFLFAPFYHSAMKHAAIARKAVGFRTIFNLLGPLANPAGTKRQLIGLFDFSFATKIARVLKETGSRHVLIVSGRDGLDEISISEETDIVELKEGEIHSYSISPEQFGMSKGELKDIQIQSPEESASLIQSIFKGTASESATNIVILNAAAGLYVAGQTASIQQGVRRVRQALSDGTVQNYFEQVLTKKGGKVHVKSNP